MSRKDLSRMGGRRIQQPMNPNRQQNPAAVRDDARYLYDLKIGDAGAGWRRNRRRIIFSRLFDDVDGSTLNPFTKKYAMVQDPPIGITYDDCRYKMFNVKFWGQSNVQVGLDGDELFLPDRKSRGPDTPTTQISTPLKGYIQTDDGMYYTFDILGRRSFEIYSTHVDAGILAPESSYDATALPGDGSKDIAYDGIVDQSYVGVAVSSVVQNSTQAPDDSTRQVRLERNVPQLVPVIPGSRMVSITPGDYLGDVIVEFSWNPNPAIGSFKGFTEISVSDEVVSGKQTRPLFIPGSPFIRLFSNNVKTTPVTLTFTSEL